MAEIILDGIKYTAIDDKTVEITSARYNKKLQKNVKINGKEYIVTRIFLLQEFNGIIPDSVTSIVKLSECSNITISSAVTSIGSIYGCSNITIPDSVTELGPMNNCRNMKVIFPKGIKTLRGISGLKNITIPDTVTSIGGLSNCSNITMPNSVTSIGGLSNCSNITIPNSVTSIGGLSNCSNITIPDSVISIGKVLHNCSNITMLNPVTSIGEISNCSNIAISNSVTSIKGIYTSTLTIPASVTTINEISGENGCLMLMMESKTPPTLAKAVYLAKDDTLTVPVGAAEAYKNHPMWGKFKNISERNIPAPSASTNTKKVEPKVAPKAQPKKETSKPEVKRPTEEGMKALDRLIDAALENFIITDGEKNVLLKKSKEIGLDQTEFELYLNDKILERMKEKPEGTPKPEVKRPTEEDMKALDRLIDAALEDFILTDDERKVLLDKVNEIGFKQSEFELYLNGKIQERMKDKPEEKVEEKKKGFFARLFGR